MNVATISRRVQFVTTNKSNFLGLCWFKSTESSEECVDRLNSLVDEKVLEFIAESKRTGLPVPLEVAAVMNGNVVYKKNLMWVPIVFATISFSILGYHIRSHPLSVIVSFIVSFFWYDVFSGILHKSLDNPDFIALPIFREPCLEFQWHHHIPQDLVSKPFLQVCGDLNLTISILFSMYLLPYVGMSFRTPMALCLVAAKILMAYFGQLCHTMSHMPSTRRPLWVSWAQEHGLMINAKDHLKHHKEYTDHFCIGSGLSNITLSYFFGISNNKWFWLLVFATTLFVDVPIFNHFLCHYIGFE